LKNTGSTHKVQCGVVDQLLLQSRLSDSAPLV